MTRKRSSEYVPAPTIPREMVTRYDAILGALYGSVSVSEAAERAGLSRNRFQSLMHRAQAAFLEALEPRSAGRPPTKTAREKELEEEVAKSHRRESTLREQLEMAQHLFGVAGEMMRGIRRGARGRQARKSAAKTPSSATDPEPATTPRRSPRWMGRMRVELGRRLLRTASRMRPISDETYAAVEDLVRETKGQIGGDAIRVQVGSVSRRQAGAIKREVVTAIERDRKRDRARVRVCGAGAVRGFDAMHVKTTEGMHYVLVCADAAIPYRTTLVVVPHYDGPSVEAALAQDIEHFGAPLAYRLDRAKCHAADSGHRDHRDRRIVITPIGPS